MPASTLAQKLKLQPGMQACVPHAPAGYMQRLAAPRTQGVDSELRQGPFDWLQVFVRNQAGLKTAAPRLKSALKPQSLLWIAYPKGASGLQTDLTRDKGWEALKPLDLQWVTLISVDEAWSAFALGPYKTGEKRQSFR